MIRSHQVNLVKKSWQKTGVLVFARGLGYGNYGYRRYSHILGRCKYFSGFGFYTFRNYINDDQIVQG